MSRFLRAHKFSGIMGFEHVEKWEVVDEDGKFMVIVGRVDGGLTPKFKLVHSSIKLGSKLPRNCYFITYEMDDRGLVINTRAPVIIDGGEIRQEIYSSGQTREVLMAS